MAEWIGEYFERGYAQRWGMEPPSRATYEEVRCLSELLQLGPGDQLLDIGCGHRRHAVAFGERGVSVTGLDSSATLLERARDLADRSGVAVAWVRGDMRRLPFRPWRFQAAILFDAFGLVLTPNPVTFANQGPLGASLSGIGCRPSTGCTFILSYSEGRTPTPSKTHSDGCSDVSTKRRCIRRIAWCSPIR